MANIAVDAFGSNRGRKIRVKTGAVVTSEGKFGLCEETDSNSFDGKPTIEGCCAVVDIEKNPVIEEASPKRADYVDT